jgi:DNA (cytosine-5)-methyltransferase 1
VATIPFIDIFAGPGGLSEGFSRFSEFTGDRTTFASRLAIEKDQIAAQTLRLRSFFRSFATGEAPDAFYDIIRGHTPAASLALLTEWQQAENHVWNVTLGEIPEATLHRRITESLNGERNWVLLGGPPCQAYSLMGRARMTGIGTVAREAGLGLDQLRAQKLADFATDHRHVLYREYLRIVAVHEPAVFVMENVKGILSSRRRDENGADLGRVFEQIRTDLSDPKSALESDADTELLLALKRSRSHKYRLYSFVVGGDRADDQVGDYEFLIRAEDYGVPQKRHRVILLGVRDDIDVAPTSLGAQPATTVRDAIGTLPALRSGVSKTDTNWTAWLKATRQAFRELNGVVVGSQETRDIICDFLSGEGGELTRGSAFIKTNGLPPNSELGRWYHDHRLGGVIQHEARSHMPSDLARYAFAAATAEFTGSSPKLEHWPPELLPNHQNVRHDELKGRVIADGFSDRFKVQVWSEPASTVTSHISKDGHYFIHPDPMQCRSLTVREAARLQTFPDNYFFCGNRTQQYHQVGNAVPPYLAFQIAGVVAGLMEEATDG